MIAKGLDYPNITLVGVLNAHTMLNLPDVRARELTTNYNTQVAVPPGVLFKILIKEMTQTLSVEHI